MDLSEAQNQRLLQINELDELQKDPFHYKEIIQHQRASWHDKFKYFKGKFRTRGLGLMRLIMCMKT
jgi:hypothetical protein